MFYLYLLEKLMFWRSFDYIIRPLNRVGRRLDKLAARQETKAASLMQASIQLGTASHRAEDEATKANDIARNIHKLLGQ